MFQIKYTYQSYRLQIHITKPFTSILSIDGSSIKQYWVYIFSKPLGWETGLFDECYRWWPFRPAPVGAEPFTVCARLYIDIDVTLGYIVSLRLTNNISIHFLNTAWQCFGIAYESFLIALSTNPDPEILVSLRF